MAAPAALTEAKVTKLMKQKFMIFVVGRRSRGDCEATLMRFSLDGHSRLKHWQLYGRQGTDENVVVLLIGLIL